MKKEDLQKTTVYGSDLAPKLQERETLLEKFISWFRDFLEASE